MIRRRPESNKMSCFSVSFEVANNDDMAAARRGALEPSEVLRMTISGLVDPGASRLVLPKHVVKQLGLQASEYVKVRYADGRTPKRPVVQGDYVELLGRSSIFRATIEPKRDTALIMAIVLEALIFLIDGDRQRLVPRDPKFILTSEE
jgi:predicted aspartyl protease